MPQRKSCNSNNNSKRKKGHAPAHQNTFAYRHNPKSKLTAKILASPNEGLCKRCHDKIEWRKQFRKYKPLTQPATCNLCKRRNVTAAYHTICGSCAKGDVAWEKMMKFKSENGNENGNQIGSDHIDEGDEINEPQEHDCNAAAKRGKGAATAAVCAMCRGRA